MTPKWIKRHLEPGEIVLHIARPSHKRVLGVLCFYFAVLAPLAWALGSEWRTILVSMPIAIVLVVLFFNRTRIVLTNRRLFFRDAVRSLDPPDIYALSQVSALRITRQCTVPSVHFDIAKVKDVGISWVANVDALVERITALKSEHDLKIRDRSSDWRSEFYLWCPLALIYYGTLGLGYALTSYLRSLATDGLGCQSHDCLAADLLMIPVVAASFVICLHLTVPLALTICYPLLDAKQRRLIAVEISSASDRKMDLCTRLLFGLSSPITIGYLSWLYGRPIDFTPPSSKVSSD
ncbi:MAG: hypothetical protein AAF495_05350 [Pseudomonadota bacterium]